jgi:hypothetical protein
VNFEIGQTGNKNMNFEVNIWIAYCVFCNLYINVEVDCTLQILQNNECHVFKEEEKVSMYQKSFC